MSFKSRHIQENLFPQMFVFQVQFNNVKDLTAYFKKVGWTGLIREEIALTGHTRFNELPIIAAFLKHNLEIKAASLYIGYKPDKNGHPGAAFNKRLSKSSHCYTYQLLKCLISADMMPKDCTPIFVTSLNVYGKNVRKGKIAFKFRHIIAQGALMEFKGKKEAAASLGITLRILNENL